MRSRKQLMDIIQTFSEGISKCESELGHNCWDWNKRIKGFENDAPGAKKVDYIYLVVVWL